MKGRQKAAEATTAWKKKSAEKKRGEEEERRGEGLEEDVSREPNESSVSFSLLTSAQDEGRLHSARGRNTAAEAGARVQKARATFCKRRPLVERASVASLRRRNARRSPNVATTQVFLFKRTR